jgi:hypothetical protein
MEIKMNWVDNVNFREVAEKMDKNLEIALNYKDDI